MKHEIRSHIRVCSRYVDMVPAKAMKAPIQTRKRRAKRHVIIVWMPVWKDLLKLGYVRWIKELLKQMHCPSESIGKAFGIENPLLNDLLVTIFVN